MTRNHEGFTGANPPFLNKTKIEIVLQVQFHEMQLFVLVQTITV